MVPDLELEVDPTNFVDEKNIHVSSFPGLKVLQIENNNNDNAFEKEALPIEKSTLSIENEDAEVNITECTRSSEPSWIREDNCGGDGDGDATECSSSFGDTGSGRESASAFSDDEVTSYMYGKDPFSAMFLGHSEPALIRKKKLTSHWENFIRPLKWRCKWLELKLKKLQSQEHKYEKELAAYDYRRQLVAEKFSLDGCDTKSIPLPVRFSGKKVIKREKRKKLEETCNLASYTSDHTLLSYFEEKDRTAHARLKNDKGVAEGSNKELIKMKVDLFSHLENDSPSSLDLDDTDKTLVNIFDQIEAARFEVHKLKSRIDKVVSGRVPKSSFVNNLTKLGLEPSNGLNPHNPNSASTSRIKNTTSARNLIMKKTKESVEEPKSDSPVQASGSDPVAKNVESKNLRLCSPSKSNVPEKKRRKRKKSGSKWGAGIFMDKPKLRK